MTSPCPSCHRRDKLFEQSTHFTCPGKYIYCGRCEIFGDVASSSAGAIALWNRGEFSPLQQITDEYTNAVDPLRLEGRIMAHAG
jgi:hypothetical protein